MQAFKQWMRLDKFCSAEGIVHWHRCRPQRVRSPNTSRGLCTRLGICGEKQTNCTRASRHLNTGGGKKLQQDGSHIGRSCHRNRRRAPSLIDVAANPTAVPGDASADGITFHARPLARNAVTCAVTEGIFTITQSVFNHLLPCPSLLLSLLFVMQARRGARKETRRWRR